MNKFLRFMKDTITGSNGRKFWLTAFLLLLIRVFSGIPVYGVDKTYLKLWASTASSTFGMMNMLSGNAFSQLSFMAIGINAYITATIIIQLLSVAIPKLEEISKDGARGEKQKEIINYISAIIVATTQAFAMSYYFSRQSIIMEGQVFIVAIQLIFGASLAMLFGYVIDKKGIKNGTSLILLTNILSTIPSMYTTITKTEFDKGVWQGIVGIIVEVILTLAFLYYLIQLTKGEKRIPILHSNNHSGYNNGGTTKDYIPVKLSAASVLPVIFIASIAQLYSIIMMFANIDSGFFYQVQQVLSISSWFNFTKDKWYYTLGIVPYFILLYLFVVFYVSIIFKPDEIAENLRKSGATIAGIRAGKPTEDYVHKVEKGLRIPGTVGLLIAMIMPAIIGKLTGVNIPMGGTSFIIIVGVIIDVFEKLDTDRQYNVQYGKNVRGIF